MTRLSITAPEVEQKLALARLAEAWGDREAVEAVEAVEDRELRLGGVKGSAEFALAAEVHRPAIERYIRRRVRCRDDAEDLAQSVMVSAWFKADCFAGEGDLSAWLHGIARNVLHQHWASERRRAAYLRTVAEAYRLRRFDWSI